MARGELPYRDSVLTQLPGAQFILGLYYSFIAPSLFSTQCLTALFNWMTAWMLWRIGNILSGPFIGAVAALLFSWAPATLAHHVFEPEVLSAALIAAILLLMLDPQRSIGVKIPVLVFLTAIGFFIKATFGLAVLGATAGIALTDRRAALRYFAIAMAAMLAIIALLGIAFGREFFIQAILFQAMKGPLPLAHRLNSYFIATTPILFPAIAGFLSKCSDLRWRIVALMSLFTSALVLMGPTYWSHNAIDPLVPMTLLAAAGWDEARKFAKGNLHVLFARTACLVSLLLLGFLGMSGRMPFVTEGVDRSEIRRTARTIEDLGRAGTVMYAPSVLIFETNSSGYIRHPEFYGVYLWIKESADRDGILATLRSASEDTFSARMARQKGRWEEDVYRAIEESRLRTVVYEPLRSDSADALDLERLRKAGMTPVTGSEGFYQVWTK